MRGSTVVHLLLCGIATMTACHAQEGATWNTDSIARFKEVVMPQVDSLGAFASLESHRAATTDANQEQRTRALALKALSEIRIHSHAADIARNNLSLYRPALAFEGRYELSDWPGADALAKMGSNAYPAIFSRLSNPCSELEIALAVHIVLRIDGRELGICRLKMKQRDVGENNSSLRINLRRVLTIIEDKDLAPAKYSPKVIYREGQKNPKLLQADDDE